MTRRRAAAHENHERWLVSYADFITLLFAFFVVMFASTQTDKNKAKEVSDSVRQALEHGQFSAAISTVLGRGKHEAQKAPLSQEATPERENPTRRRRAPPESHPPDLAKSLDTLQKGLDVGSEERQAATQAGRARADHQHARKGRSLPRGIARSLPTACRFSPRSRR